MVEHALRLLAKHLGPNFEPFRHKTDTDRRRRSRRVRRPPDRHKNYTSEYNSDQDGIAAIVPFLLCD